MTRKEKMNRKCFFCRGTIFFDIAEIPLLAQALYDIEEFPTLRACCENYDFIYPVESWEELREELNDFAARVANFPKFDLFA